MRRRQVLGAMAFGGALVLAPGRAFAGAGQVTTGSTDEAEIARIASAYFTDRALRVTAARPSTAALSQISATSAFQSVYRADADRLDTVRSDLTAMHGGYRTGGSTARVDSLQADKAGATAVVTEQTDLYFSRTLVNNPDHTTYRASHRLTLARTAGTWALDSAVYLPENPYSTPVTQFQDTLAAPAAPLGSKPSSDKPLSANDRQAAAEPRLYLSASYNYSAMINYARTWALGRNPAYPSYSDDCTNFVSQSMRAGGWGTVGSANNPIDLALHRGNNSYWWYGGSPSTSSYTWGGAENWYWFATGTGRTYILGSIWSLLGSDVLQYDYDHDGNISHTQICTGSNGSSPLMTQHGSDYRDKPLTEIMANSSNANAWLYAHRT